MAHPETIYRIDSLAVSSPLPIACFASMLTGTQLGWKRCRTRYQRVDGVQGKSMCFILVEWIVLTTQDGTHHRRERRQQHSDCCR